MWWLFISLHRYGGLPAWLAVLAVALLCMAPGAVPGAGAWRCSRVGAAAAWRSTSLLFAALWLLAELARTVIFTGFPWLASGYSQVDARWPRWAPWIGV